MALLTELKQFGRQFYKDVAPHGAGIAGPVGCWPSGEEAGSDGDRTDDRQERRRRGIFVEDRPQHARSPEGAASRWALRRMPLLTELQNHLGGQFYKDGAPDGAVCGGNGHALQRWRPGWGLGRKTAMRCNDGAPDGAFGRQSGHRPYKGAAPEGASSSSTGLKM